MPAERLDWRRRRKRWLADREPLLPGVAGLLDAAAQRDIPVVVVSSSPRSWVNGHLTRLGAADRLAFLVTGEDAVSHKPAPDLYLAALSRAGVAARTAVALEDSPSGVQAARGAGVPCVAVAGSGGAAGTRYDLTAADLVLDSVERFDLDSPVLAERM